MLMRIEEIDPFLYPYRRSKEEKEEVERQKLGSSLPSLHLPSFLRIPSVFSNLK